MTSLQEEDGWNKRPGHYLIEDSDFKELTRPF